MVYRLLRALLRHALSVFFRRVELEGVEEVPLTGPLLLAANHPNTLIDVLLVATALERRVRFVAKATLFQNPLAGALLRALGAVPIHRRQDGPVDARQNQNVLAACEDAVAAGEAILIFPEGVSQDAPRLMELKTGLARIALGAEAKVPGRVVVVPAALVYDDPGTFRSHARVRFAPPIHAAPFQRLGEEAGDPFVGVRALTEAVRAALITSVVHVERPDLAPVLRDLDALYGRDASAAAGGRLAATAAIARAMNDFAAREPERVERLRRLLEEYRAALGAAGVDDEVARERRAPLGAGDHVLFWLGAPLALWGAVNHFVLYQLPRLVLKLVPTDRLYASTVKLVVGLLGLFACYGLQTWGVLELSARALEGTSPWTPALLYLGTLPLSGLAALLWLEAFLARRHAARVRRARRRLPPETLAELERRRRELIDALEAAQAEWLADAEAPPEDPAEPL